MAALTIEARDLRDTRQLRALRMAPAARTAAGERLIERGHELAVLNRAVSSLEDGEGGVIVFEAPAGLGKSALLEHAAQLAMDAGCLVRRAEPGPLERQFAFGVLRALLEAPLHERDEAELAQLLDGPAGIAGALLLDGAMPGEEASMIVAHSVLWLAAGLARQQPLALIVDDAQWSDRASLAVLAYLARRIDDVPLLIVVAARADDPGGELDLLRMLGAARCATVMHPRPLTRSGAVRLIHRLAPSTPVQVCCELHAATHGYPWLLAELARQLRSAGPGVTEAGRRTVRRRMAELAQSERDLAAATAVIGRGHPAHVVAAAAGLSLTELATASEALAAAGLFIAGEQRFTHELIADAIARDLTSSESDRWQRDAARALTAGGATADVVARHLLRTAPHADPAASATLLRAAEDATARGVPVDAVAYLERALAERAAGDDRSQMLVHLATASFDAGRLGTVKLLREALSETHDDGIRVDILTRLSALSLIEASEVDVPGLLGEESIRASDPTVRDQIEAVRLDALLPFAERRAEHAERAAALAARTSDPLLRRVAAAHRARVATEEGVPDADATAGLALEALTGGLLLAEAWRRPAYHLATRALIACDRPAEAAKAIDDLHAHAHARGSLRVAAAADWYAAELALRGGQVREAEEHARAALRRLGDSDTSRLRGGALVVLAEAVAEQGKFEPAQAILDACAVAGSPAQQQALSHARARAWLAQGEFERAYAELGRAGLSEDSRSGVTPMWLPWRSTAAVALAHLGRHETAIALAEHELGQAERFGAPVPVARALVARAVADPDRAARVAICRRALNVLQATPAVLDATRARLELGSSLTYLGHRIEAREALRPALADADAIGALPLAQRARAELVASGLRPRQAAIAGAAALTPRQRQICELAAAGKANRAIAQQLFLSIKTVETHLAAAFRKLGVTTRDALAAELAG
jgi:DNA-binding CsgD family transcriptional regulator